MHRRHQYALANALDPLCFGKSVVISRKLLRHWLEVERIRTRAWETLAEYLPEGVELSSLCVVEDDDDIILFHREKMTSFG